MKVMFQDMLSNAVICGYDLPVAPNIGSMVKFENASYIVRDVIFDLSSKVPEEWKVVIRVFEWAKV